MVQLRSKNSVPAPVTQIEKFKTASYQMVIMLCLINVRKTFFCFSKPYSYHYCLLTLLSSRVSTWIQWWDPKSSRPFCFYDKIKPMWCETFYEMTKCVFVLRFLFAFRFLSYLVYASQYRSPAIVGDQGDFEVHCPITFLPHSHILSLCWCTVDIIQYNSLFYHLWEWDLFIDVHF